MVVVTIRLSLLQHPRGFFILPFHAPTPRPWITPYEFFLAPLLVVTALVLDVFRSDVLPLSLFQCQSIRSNSSSTGKTYSFVEAIPDLVGNGIISPILNQPRCSHF